MFAANNNAQTQTGPELPEILTEGIGYQAIAGDKKLQLTSPWPSDELPKPTSTLISIASRNELIAAAGPSTLVIASTSAVRGAFVANTPAKNNVKSFTPQLTIDVPRLSQVAFTSDENYLVICAEEGGGLSVYDVQDLKNGKTQPAFQLGTHGTAVRALVPNPAPETGNVAAIVLTNGQLLLANLKERQFTNGTNDAVLREGVSCVSWSAKGKQLVAGLGNGTAVQMDPAGDVKAEIPRPPQLGGDQHVAGITWLANDLFLTIYNPTNFEMEHVPDSTYILVTRQPKTSNFTFQNMTDPVGTFGMNRCPPHHFMQRLRDFPPNLTDVILLSSTGSGDIGLITCSKVPLSSEPEAANTANTYTVTAISDDSRRAQLPVYEEMNDMSGSADTSPIGMVLDLSSRDNVKRPMPAEEIDASSTPLPALMVLNNEGVLSAWWFVYSESVRQKTVFPGLVSVTANQASAQAQPQQSSPFGATSQAPSSGFGISKAPAFGASSFGMQNAQGGTAGLSLTGVSSFGALSTPGANPGAWGSSGISGANSQFGKPAFGTPTNLSTATKPAFGTSSPLGSSSNPAFGASTPLGATSKLAFGSNTALGASNSAFGAAGGLGKAQSPWGATSNSASGEKPNAFGGSSAVSGFAALGQSGDQPFSPFSKLTSTTSSFGTLGQKQTPSVFGAPASTSNANQPSSLSGTFGAPSTVGQNKSLWGLPAQVNSLSGPAAKSLPENNNLTDADADMDEDTPTTERPTIKSQNPFGTASTGFQLGSSFKGDGTAKDDLPKPAGDSLFGTAFGSALADAQHTPAIPIKEEPKSPPPLTTSNSAPKPAASGKPSSSLVSQQPPKADENTERPATQLQEPPLPPDPSSITPKIKSEPAPFPPLLKSQEAQNMPSLPDESHDSLSPAGSPPVDLGETDSPLSSARSFQSSERDAGEPDDAPLPPDFMPKPPQASKTPDEAAITPAKNLSPPDLRASPLSSSSVQKASLASFSTTPLHAQTAQLPQGPASATKPPVFFQPPSNFQDGPRSPSPVRNKRGAVGPRSLLSPTSQSMPSFSTTPAGPPPAKVRNQAPAQQPLFQLPKPQILPPKLPEPELEPEPEPEPEIDELFDDTDQDIRDELAQAVEASKTLAPFIAHQDYVGKVGGDSVPAQVERLFRDINSMIDTYGLNARSLSSFVKGHSELLPDGGRERADLEDDADWCLAEVEDLTLVQKNILEELESEKPQDANEKVEELRHMMGEVIKQRKRQHEVQKVIDLEKKSNEDTDDVRVELTTEQSAVLSDLKNDFASFQKVLAESEDNISMLKARLAFLEARNNNGTSAGKVPTVEAVVNTILKMTRMFEEKSGDIDLLEAQMRKWKFKSRSSREGTPSTLNEALGKLSLGSNGHDRDFDTPPSSRTKRAGTYELNFTPESSDDELDEYSSFRNSLRSSQGASAKKQLNLPKVTNQEIKIHAMAKSQRKQFMQLLKENVSKKGSRTTT